MERRILQATLRVDARLIANLGKALLAMRDEVSKLDIYRETAVRVAADACRLRADVTQAEQKITKALQAALALIDTINEGSKPRGLEEETNGG